MRNAERGTMAHAPTPISVPVDDGHTSSDAELIQQCLQGEEQAWATLLDRYGSLIYSIALKLQLSPEDAADVFQSVCLAMIKGLRGLKDATKLSSWVATTTQRYCYRLWAQADRHGANSEPVEEDLTHLPSDTLLPDEMMEKLEQERLLRQAVSMLDEPCRHLVAALFYEDEPRPYDQLAKEMGLSVSTLGPKRARCLKRIRKILAELKF